MSSCHHVTGLFIVSNVLQSTYLDLMPLTDTCSLHLQLSGLTDGCGIHRSLCHPIYYRAKPFMDYLYEPNASCLYMVIASTTFRLDGLLWDPPVTMSPYFLYSRTVLWHNSCHFSTKITPSNFFPELPQELVEWASSPLDWSTLPYALFMG